MRMESKKKLFVQVIDFVEDCLGGEVYTAVKA